jgi:large subunit ribosomal protein MRP49
MTVARTDDTSGPATMTLHFSSPSSDSASNAIPNPSITSESMPTATRTATIEMKDLEPSAILEQLMALTKARAVRTDPEDVKLAQELEEKEARSSRVRELMAAAMARRKREKDILAQARGEVEALKNEE